MGWSHGGLRHRERTGEGQRVDVALVDCLMFQSNGCPTAGALGLPLERRGNQFNLAAPSNSYACRDGRVYAGVLLDSHWRRLAQLLGRADLVDLTTMERLKRRAEVDGLLANYCAARTTASAELADGRSAPLTSPPVKFSRTPTRIRTRAARLGEHNEQVLSSLGLTPEEIAALVRPSELELAGGKRSKDLCCPAA